MQEIEPTAAPHPPALAAPPAATPYVVDTLPLYEGTKAGWRSSYPVGTPLAQHGPCLMTLDVPHGHALLLHPLERRVTRWVLPRGACLGEGGGGQIAGGTAACEGAAGGEGWTDAGM